MIQKQITKENFGYKIIIGLFIVFQILILVNILFFSDSTAYLTRKNFLFPNRILFIFSLAVCLLALSFGYIQERYFKLRFNPYLFIIAASALLFAVQLFISFHMYFYTGWDVEGIRATVNDFVYNHHPIGTDSNLYPFSRYPNNINLTVILILVEKTFLHLGLNGYSGSLILSALLVNLAGVFTFLSTYTITRKGSYAAFSWLMFAFLVALSPWISIPYSDTYGILFPILAFYLYISKKPDSKAYLRWFSIGFLCFLGYTIKPTTIIILIAILLLEFWKILTRFDKQSLLNLFVSLVFLASAILPALVISSYSQSLMANKPDKNQEFTLHHFAMMGLNADRDGIYSQEDVDYSASFSTVKERNDANIAVIKQRLNTFGLIGYFQFLGRKALVNFSDGSFAWNGEGHFFTEVPKREGNIAAFFTNLYYPDGKYYSFFLTGVQILWIAVLILLLGLGLILKIPDYKSVGIILAILGISSFVMIFEARARQLYCYSPFYMIGAGIGLSLCKSFLDQKFTIRRSRRSAS